MILTGRMVGAETIVTDLRRLEGTIRQKLRDEVARLAQELAVRAAAAAPHKTGALRSSIRAQGIENETAVTARVGTDLHYARFQESGWTPNPKKAAGWRRNPRKAVEWKAYQRQMGGRRIVAHPFLKPALASMRGTIRSRLLAVVRGEM